MEKYIILVSKTFEKMDKYQARVNDQARKGYRAVSMVHSGGALCTLFKKIS